MSAVNEEVNSLAEKLVKELHYNKDTHVVTDEKAYEKHLPDGLDMDTVHKVNNYDVQFVAASGKAVGVVAIEHMAKDPGLDRVSAEFTMGKKNAILHVVNREQSFTNIADPAQPVHKYGNLTSTLRVQAGRNQGQLKKVRDELHELAAAQLNK